MPRFLLERPWIVIGSCVVFLIVTKSYVLTTESIDFAVHLSLVDYIYQNGAPPVWGSALSQYEIPRLGVMTYYPPVAHAVAAALAWILGSETAGLIACGLLSIFAFYALLTYAVLRQGQVVAAGLFIVAICVFRSTYVFHGSELIENFFFAQIFGSALMLALLYVSLLVLDGWRSVILAVVGAYALTWTYLLSEIVFCASFLAALLIDTASSAIDRRPDRNGNVLRLIVSGVVLAALTASSPEVRVMLGIATNDGGIHPDLSPGIIGVAAFLSLAASAGAWFVSRDRDRRYATFVAAYAIGISSCLLLQYVAFRLFNSGSAYAIKKYTFDVFTVLALAVTFLLGTVQRKLFTFEPLSLCTTASIAGLMAFIIVEALYSVSPAYDARPLSAYLEYNRHLADYELPADAQFETLSINQVLSPSSWLTKVFNFATMTIAYHVPARKAQNVVYNGMRDGIRYTVVAAPDALEADAGCVRRPATHVEVVVLDYACSVASAANATYGKPVEVRPGALAASFLTSGWGSPEPNGAWSVADTTSLKIKVRGLSQRDHYTLTLDFSGVYLSEQHSLQHVIVTVDQKEVGRAEMHYGVPLTPVALQVSADMIHDKTANVGISFPDAVSPHDTDGSADVRKLGAKLDSFTFGD